MAKFADLLGKTLVHCARLEDVLVGGVLQDALVFETSNGERFRLTHNQDGYENVHVEDIAGDLELLLGRPLLMAEETSGTCEAGTWTFYKLANALEYVTIRWLGESNGYYSERVDFEQWNAERRIWE